MKEYSSTCPWMNDPYGLKYGLKEWMNFILNVSNKHYFCEKLSKRNKVETIYLGFFKII